MLLQLHVKNLALIDEVEVDFQKGLNILTGETGAGKSVLLGAIHLALGGKADKDMIRRGEEYALVELTFLLEDKKQEAFFVQKDLTIEDGIVVLQRKLYPARNVYRLNGETVSASLLKEIAPVLLDIYGQHDYQNLINAKKHQTILDSFLDENATRLLIEIRDRYREYSKLVSELEAPEMDDVQRRKEIDFAQYEIKEIEQASLKVGEEEELSEYLKRAENAERILSTLCESLNCLSGMNRSAEELLDRAMQELSLAKDFDETVFSYSERLNEISSLLSDLNREMKDYCDELEFDPKELSNARNRYDEINRLEMKYGKTIEAVISYSEHRKEYVKELEEKAGGREALKTKLDAQKEELTQLCENLTDIRTKEAKHLEKEIMHALKELNFLKAEFEISVSPKESFTENGKDEIAFLISTNPGEVLKPIQQIASGGELSRIMLALKTVLAKREEINTLIFDEIDSGISGKTAWKVSEMLGKLSKDHQIICITHLPQIAAMADCHYEISKMETDGSTKTKIFKLSEEQSLNEIGRLLGGEELTDSVMNNAKELKNQAKNAKGMV